MRYVCAAGMLVLGILRPSVTWGAAALTPGNVTVGQNLEAGVTIRLSEAAPVGGLEITLTSNDPGKLRLSKKPEIAGSSTIRLTVQDHSAVSPEFFVQAIGDGGTATYTATSPECESGIGTVTLAPSAIVIASASRIGHPLVTAAGTVPAKINVYSAQLDSSGDVAAVQPVRGGLSAVVTVTSSDTAVGTVAASPLTIEGGLSTATTRFLPASPGETTLAAGAPGFTGLAPLASLQATVRKPGMALTSATIGQNLQVSGDVVLGGQAPEGGLDVTLTSSDPDQLLLSAGETNPGSKSVTITVPAGATSARYYLQALGSSGEVTYAASAPGFLSKTGSVTLTPSGVLLGMFGPPDEAELFRKESADAPHGFAASLSGSRTTPVMVYTAQLDPVHHRAADITVQSLRAGLSLQIALESSDPTVGTIASTVNIGGGSRDATAPFTAMRAGSTVISVATPEGFTTAGNATSLTAIVGP